MRKKEKKNKSIILRLMVLGVCVYMLATLAGLWNTLNTSRTKLAALKADYSSETNEIEELKSLLDGGSDAQLIEKAARDRLGYVYSDEQIYIDISGS